VLAAILSAALLISCGGDTAGPPVPASIRLEPERTLLVSVGQAVRFTAEARDAAGRSIPDATLTWTSARPSVATVSPAGVATAVSAGVTTISAESGAARGTASLEVYLRPEREHYAVDSAYFGRQGYVEYLPGDLPVVLSAPHGGDLEPDEEIPDRLYGVTAPDRNTMELALAIRDALLERTGHTPHVVISHLARIKLDPNREIVEAAQGNPFAENAWAEFHDFIDDARRTVTVTFGSGLYLDIHGHGHPIARVELGYLLTSSDLEKSDKVLDGTSYVNASSVRALYAMVDIPFSALLRGPTSFGGYLGSVGVRSVPSPQDPDPGGNPYFSGGYDTRVHGSRNGGTVSGIQLEHPFGGIRDTDADRRAYARRLAEVIESFMLEHYGFFSGQ